MTDHDEIRNLCYRYTFAVDDGDFAEVGRVLGRARLRPMMPGVVSEPIVGPAEIERFYTDQVIVYDKGGPRTRHLITNQVLAVDGDVASARCYFTVLQRPPGQDYQIVVGGQYHDRFVREDGCWRFAEKAIQVDHLNRIESHFRIEPARWSGDPTP